MQGQRRRAWGGSLDRPGEESRQRLVATVWLALLQGTTTIHSGGEASRRSSPPS